MRETTENTSNPLTNLVSTLNNFERQQIDNAFADMDNLFKDWLLFEDADDQKRRQNYLISLKVIQELGKVVKATPLKKEKAEPKLDKKITTELSDLDIVLLRKGNEITLKSNSVILLDQVCVLIDALEEIKNL